MASVGMMLRQDPAAISPPPDEEQLLDDRAPAPIPRLVGRSRSETIVSERLTLTVDEAAHLLGIGRDLAYSLSRTGQLRTVRLGRRILVPRDAIRELLER